MTGIPYRVAFTNWGQNLLVTSGADFDLYRHGTWNTLNLIEKGLGIPIDLSIPTTVAIDPDALASIDKRLEKSTRGGE